MLGFFGTLIWLEKKVESNNRGTQSKENGDAKDLKKITRVVPSTFIRNLRVLT